MEWNCPQTGRVKNTIGRQLQNTATIANIQKQETRPILCMAVNYITGTPSKTTQDKPTSRLREYMESLTLIGCVGEIMQQAAQAFLAGMDDPICLMCPQLDMMYYDKAMKLEDSNKSQEAMAKEVAILQSKTLGYKIDTSLDKIIGFCIGHAAQETNQYLRDIQIKSCLNAHWGAASAGNTLLGNIRHSGYLVCNKVNVNLSSIASMEQIDSRFCSSIPLGRRGK